MAPFDTDQAGNDPGEGASLWDVIAPEYDAWYSGPVGSYVLDKEIAALTTLVGERPGRFGLDVGCGTGQFSRAFARFGLTMVGVDLSAAMLAAMPHGSEALLPCQAAGEQLPFGPASFDLVMAVTALEFVHNPAWMLNEMWRVLKPGGRLLVGALNAWSLWAAARRLGRRDMLFSRAHFFHPLELGRMLAQFGRVRWRGAVFIPPWVKGQVKTSWNRIEVIGARALPMFGAFLAAAVCKPVRED